MRTHATEKLPEIQWSVDGNNDYATIDDEGVVKQRPAWGESEDGRKWMATAHLLWDVGETVIDLDSIEPDTA